MDGGQAVPCARARKAAFLLAGLDLRDSRAVPARDFRRTGRIELTIFGTLLGFFVGFSLGLLGGGGSVLTVPIFVYILGVDSKTAIVSSLVVVGASALIGALRHARDGNVEVRIAIGFGVFTAAGAFGGARLGTRLSDVVQLILFATVMLIAAVLMYRGRRDPEESAGDSAKAHSWLIVALAALGVGVLTGLVGVGGGFMIVPALVLLLRVPMKKAIGTSLLVIPITAASGFSGYLGTVDVPWRLLLPFGALSVVGIFLGVHLTQYASPAALKKGFAIFLMVVAVFILVEKTLTFGA